MRRFDKETTTKGKVSVIRYGEDEGRKENDWVKFILKHSSIYSINLFHTHIDIHTSFTGNNEPDTYLYLADWHPKPMTKRRMIIFFIN